MTYYNRPKLVRNMLQSIKDSTYNNWELVFIDDGSQFSGKEIVEEMMPDKLDKVIFYGGSLTSEEKMKIETRQAEYYNDAIKNTDADIGLFLCDDDVLILDYLEKLNIFYLKNPKVMYSYSHVIPFDSNIDGFDYAIPYRPGFFTLKQYTFLNKTTPINPYCNLDSTQLSWRMSALREKSITITPERQKDFDADIGAKLFAAYGTCMYNGCWSQYKNLHNNSISFKIREKRNSLEEIFGYDNL